MPQSLLAAISCGRPTLPDIGAAPFPRRAGPVGARQRRSRVTPGQVGLGPAADMAATRQVLVGSQLDFSVCCALSTRASRSDASTSAMRRHTTT